MTLREYTAKCEEIANKLMARAAALYAAGKLDAVSGPESVAADEEIKKHKAELRALRFAFFGEETC